MSQEHKNAPAHSPDHGESCDPELITEVIALREEIVAVRGQAISVLVAIERRSLPAPQLDRAISTAYYLKSALNALPKVVDGRLVVPGEGRVIVAAGPGTGDPPPPWSLVGPQVHQGVVVAEVDELGGQVEALLTSISEVRDHTKAVVGAAGEGNPLLFDTAIHVYALLGAALAGDAGADSGSEPISRL